MLPPERQLGAGRLDRGPGPDRRSCRPTRLPPPDLQRAHRAAGRRAHRRGTRYWDPLATLGYLAARTQRIRLATNVLVLAYHHPLEIAKRYGTLDKVSNGRLILGVGVGSLKEEFDLLGAPFDDRGPRGDDALRALRASLSVARTRLPRRVLFVRRHGRRPVRGPGARPDLDRWAHAAVAAPGRDPGRRLGPVQCESAAGPRLVGPLRTSDRVRGGAAAAGATGSDQRAGTHARPPRRYRRARRHHHQRRASRIPPCSITWRICRRSPSCTPTARDPRDPSQGRHFQPHRTGRR